LTQPDATILSIEPLRDPYQRLSRHAARDQRWHCVHAAASDHAGTITVKVDELIEAHSLDPTHELLKIDVQGFESAVLDGSSRHLDQLAAVQLELSLVPLYDGQALMPQLVERMSLHGFDLWLLEPGFAAPDSGRLFQCDGVFVREHSGHQPATRHAT